MSAAEKEREIVKAAIETGRWSGEDKLEIVNIDISHFGIPMPLVQMLRRDWATLSSINLTNTNINKIPKEIGGLMNLKYLSLKDNKLTEIPHQIGNCMRLQHLDLRGNSLEILPVTMGRLLYLHDLKISGNNLMEPFSLFESFDNEDFGFNYTSKLVFFFAKMLPIPNKYDPFAVDILLSACDGVTDNQVKWIKQWLLNQDQNSKIIYRSLIMDLLTQLPPLSYIKALFIAPVSRRKNWSNELLNIFKPLSIKKGYLKLKEKGKKKFSPFYFMVIFRFLFYSHSEEARDRFVGMIDLADLVSCEITKKKKNEFKLEYEIDNIKHFILLQANGERDMQFWIRTLLSRAELVHKCFEISTGAAGMAKQVQAKLTEQLRNMMESVYHISVSDEIVEQEQEQEQEQQQEKVSVPSSEFSGSPSAETKPFNVSLLFKYSHAGDYFKLKSVIDGYGSAVDVNVAMEKGFTPLHLAVGAGSISTTKYLIELGADIGAATVQGATPLHIAVSIKNLEIVKMLCSNGAPLDLRDSSGRRPIDVANLMQTRDIIRYLLTEEMTPTQREDENSSPEALEEEEVDFNAVDLITEADEVSSISGSESAVVDSVSDFSDSDVDLEEISLPGSVRAASSYSLKRHVVSPKARPCWLLAKSGNLKVLKEKLSENSDSFNVDLDNEGSNAFMISAYYGHEDIVKWFLDQNIVEIPLNYQNNLGYTAMHLAAMEKRYSIIDLITNSGADPDILDNNDKTPFNHLSDSSGVDIESNFESQTTNINQYEFSDDEREEFFGSSDPMPGFDLDDEYKVSSFDDPTFGLEIDQESQEQENEVQEEPKSPSGSSDYLKESRSFLLIDTEHGKKWLEAKSLLAKDLHPIITKVENNFWFYKDNFDSMSALVSDLGPMEQSELLDFFFSFVNDEMEDSFTTKNPSSEVPSVPTAKPELKKIDIANIPKPKPKPKLTGKLKRDDLLASEVSTPKPGVSGPDYLRNIQKIQKETAKRLLKGEKEELRNLQLETKNISEKVNKMKANLEENKLCKVCMEIPIDTVAISCGHLAVCIGCVEDLELSSCPVCRCECEFVKYKRIR